MLERPSGDLLERLRQGDEVAFAYLVDTHHASLVRLARAFVRSVASAEEVAQETWLAVLEGLDGFEARSSLKTWIFRILVNRAQTRAVREGRSVAVADIEACDTADAAAVDADRFRQDGGWARPPRRWSDETPELALLRQESLRCVADAIEELPPGQRAVLLLRDVEGESAADVCNVLAIEETNQRVLLHRARARIRRALEYYLEGEPEC